MSGFGAIVAVLGVATMGAFVLGLWVPAYLRHVAVRRRLGAFVQAGASGLAIDAGGRRRARVVPRQRREGQPLVRYIEEKILQSHADVSVGEVVAAALAGGILAFIAVSLVSRVVAVGVVAGIVGAWLPIFWLDRLRARRLRRFNTQLLDTIGLLASSVRSGHSLLQALEHVVSEAPDPTRSAFAVVVREIGLGASQESALERLADRYGSDDLELIVSSINVHQQIGGSLAKVLDSIGEMIRERQRIAADINSLTGQQRLSAYVLCALPVVVGAVLFLISPNYMAVMLDVPVLRQALIGAAVLVVAGFLIMRRLASIDV